MATDSGSLAGRLAVVTGASRGVGAAIAVALSSAGAKVVGFSRTGRSPQVAGSDDAPRGALEMIAMDLTDESAIDRACEQLGGRARSVSILVHAAGIHLAGRTQGADVAAFDQQYRANLRGPYVLTQRLLAGLIATTGDVVFINSATAGRAGVAQYAATKFGLRAFADSLRDELNPDGVRIMTVELGRTATDLQRAVHADEGRPYDPGRLIQPEDVATVVVHSIAMPRTVQVSEIRLLPIRRL